MLFGKLTYLKFIHSKLDFNQLCKEDLDNIISELKNNGLSIRQIKYIIDHKKNIFNCYRLPLKDFPIYFYDNIDDYVILVINYINNNNISSEYYCELRSILKTYLKNKGKYVTNTELNKYLNKEIKFEDIKDKFLELDLAKTLELYIKIINDLLI